jgi:tetratricopeptide (TPR) repeat protein
LDTKSDDNLAFQEMLTHAAKSYESGNIKEADALYNELLQYQTNNAELFRFAGKTAFEVEDYSRAIDNLSRAAILMPGDAVTLFFLGKSLLAKGNQRAAKINLEKAVAINPGLDLAWCMLGDIYIQQDEIDQAAKIFLEIISRDRNCYDAYSQLAVICKRKGRPMMARVFLDLFSHYYSGPSINNRSDEIYDTFFLDRDIAQTTALQKNRIWQTIAVTASQICYYQGEPFDTPPANLINIPDDEFSKFFYSKRLRRPTAIHFNPENIDDVNKALDIANSFDHILPLLRKNSFKDSESYQTLNLAIIPGEPLRILLSANRTTTVMQYSARSLSIALQRKGCNINLLTEGNDLEMIEQHHYLEECAKFIPHAVVHINHVKNQHLNKDTYNIVWWQDPMPTMKSGEPIPWRNRDLVLSACSQFDPYLHKSGADTVYRQDFCIDPELFCSSSPVENRKKIIFVGSSYFNRVDQFSEAGRQIVAILKKKMVAGEDMPDSLIHELSAKFGVKFTDIFDHLLTYIVRDTSVEWLCSLADTMDYEVEVYGRLWEQNPLVAPFFKGELTHGPMVAKVYNEAKYAVAATHRTVNSQRLSEIAACGCIPVVFDERSYPDVETPHWDDECLFYRTKDELMDCIGRSPKNDPQIIGDAYSYDNFADKLITYIKTGNYPDQPVKEFYRNISTGESL